MEDTLDDDLVPPGILQRRFSRRRLLREVRDHRAALRVLKSYIGTDPPPTYHPTSARRRCAIIGSSRFDHETLRVLFQYLEKSNYSPVVVQRSKRLPDGIGAEEVVRRAAMCLTLVEGLTPAEFYILGVARASLTPTIAITLDPAHPYSKVTPQTYSHSWLNLNDLKQALAHRHLRIDKRPPDVRALIAAMEMLAQEYGPENVRLVFCLGM